MQNLEARVKALEMGMQRILPVIDSIQGVRPSESKIYVESGANAHSRRDLEDIGEEEEEDVVPPSPEVDDAGQMTQDERGNYRWIGSSNTLSLLDSFTHRSPLPTPDQENSSSNPYFGPVAGAGVVKALPGVEEVSFPSPKASREMVDKYFEDIHPCLPIMAEHEFREEFEKLLDRRTKGLVEIGGGVSGRRQRRVRENAD